jgi:hypothetical protein
MMTAEERDDHLASEELREGIGTYVLHRHYRCGFVFRLSVVVRSGERVRHERIGPLVVDIADREHQRWHERQERGGT